MGGHPKWWTDLTPEQRLIHYKRNPPCDCPVNEQEWPKELFEAYSYDPYFHTRHSEIHSPEKFLAGKCECLFCVREIGIPVELRRKRVDEEKVRAKWQKRFAAQKLEALAGGDDVF